MRALLVLLIVSLDVPWAAAYTWTVAPDGSGEVPDLQAAVDACDSSGDSILLAAGTYTGPGNRDVVISVKSLWLGSASGDPADCTLNCGGSPGEPHRGLLFENGVPSGTTIQGITISGGDVTGAGEGGGAVKTLSSSRPSFVDCVFMNCKGGSGGAVHLLAGFSTQASFTNCVFQDNTGDYGGALNATGGAQFTDCRFENNLAVFRGGAVFALQGTRFYDRCVFRGNHLGGSTVNHSGGAVHCAYGVDVFTGCGFVANVAGSAGGIYISTDDAVTVTDCVFDANEVVWVGALYSNSESIVSVTGCTFHGHETVDSCTLKGSFLDQNGRFAIDRCIFAFNSGQGPPVQCTLTQLTCTDIYGNSDGDWTWDLAPYAGQDGNLAHDPVFCDRLGGDLTLASSSPCLPGNHPQGESCGLIGALGQGCSLPAVERASWGEIKSRY